MNISEESTRLMTNNVARQLAAHHILRRWLAAEDRRLSSAAPVTSMFVVATNVQQWPDRIDLGRLDELIEEVAQQISPHVESEVRKFNQGFQQSKGAS
jgi:hypothetical protein